MTPDVPNHVPWKIESELEIFMWIYWGGSWSQRNEKQDWIDGEAGLQHGHNKASVKLWPVWSRD